MTDKEKQELYENICNDINCGTYILAPQYVDKLLAKLERKIAYLEKENEELKEKVNILDNCDRLGDVITEAYKEQLTKGKRNNQRVCRVGNLAR